MQLAIAIFTLYAICMSIFIQPQKAPAEVTDKQWQELLTAVSKENWHAAVKLSSKYLKELKEDDDRLPRLRYIYLHAAAGKVSEGQMAFDELERVLQIFIGKNITFPYRQIAAGSAKGALNLIYPSSNSKNRLFVAATNKTGTTVHAFEYIKLKESFDVVSYSGKEASISGVIDSIKLNPNKSQATIMRIFVSKGLVKLKK